MRSIFEITNKMDFDPAAFEKMKALATETLSNAKVGQYTQAIVLFSESETLYGAVIENALSQERADERELLEKLKTNGDARIRYCLCMWQDGGVDIPSFRFRKMIYELDSANAESGIFVKTATGYAVFGLENSIK
jgi:cytidine deaminase